jgi:hypothetical protein
MSNGGVSQITLNYSPIQVKGVLASLLIEHFQAKYKPNHLSHAEAGQAAAKAQCGALFPGWLHSCDRLYVAPVRQGMRVAGEMLQAG